MQIDSMWSYILSKKNWNTKEDKGESMICTLYILQLAKTEGMSWKYSDIKQLPIALSIVELHLAEGNS